MTASNLIPTVKNFHGPTCKAVRARFDVHRDGLAAAAGVNPTELARWEKGEARQPFHGAAAVRSALLVKAIEGCDRMKARLVAMATAEVRPLVRR